MGVLKQVKVVTGFFPGVMENESIHFRNKITLFLQPRALAYMCFGAYS